MILRDFINWFEFKRPPVKDEELSILFNGLTMYFGRHTQHTSIYDRIELDAESLKEYFKNAVIFICEQQGDDLTRFAKEIESNRHTNINLPGCEPFIKEAIVQGIQEGLLEAKQRIENKRNRSHVLSCDRTMSLSSPKQFTSETPANMSETVYQNTDTLSEKAKNLLGYCLGGANNCWPSFFGNNALNADVPGSKKGLKTEGACLPSIKDMSR